MIIELITALFPKWKKGGYGFLYKSSLSKAERELSRLNISSLGDRTGGPVQRQITQNGVDRKEKVGNDEIGKRSESVGNAQIDQILHRVDELIDQCLCGVDDQGKLQQTGQRGAVEALGQSAGREIGLGGERLLSASQRDQGDDCKERKQQYLAHKQNEGEGK